MTILQACRRTKWKTDTRRHPFYNVFFHFVLDFVLLFIYLFLAAAKQAAPQTVTKTTATSSDNSASQTTEQKTRHHPVAGSGEQTVQNKGDKMQTASTSESTNSSNIKSNKLAPVQETAAASEKNNSSKETFPGFAVPKPVGFKKPKPKTKQPKESKNDEKSDCKEQKRRSAGEKREDIYVTKQETGLGFVQARDGSPIPDASDEDSSKQVNQT